MSDDQSLSIFSRSNEATSRVVAEDGGVQHGAAQLTEHRKRLRDLFNRKRVDLLDDLIRNLDVLVYAELSIIYYMDCHLIRLILRAMVQFMFLTPKPASFPRPPKPEPYVGAIIGTNLLCLILHIFGKTPSAGEATRYYLHGGLVLDFIGQKGPSSKMVLVLLDLFVVTLQLIHLSAHTTKFKLKEQGLKQPTSTVQDLDSEERGVRRSTEIQQQDAQHNVELQSLNTAGRVHSALSGTSRGREQQDEAWEVTAPRLDAFLLDSFWNGQIVLADLNPVRTAQEQIIQYQQIPLDARRDALNAQLAARMSELRYLTQRR